jgi:2-polyprenyl-3-methyl-5-hydroxy-6-metoxy-1,4-benzoquinol methylase
MKTEETVERVVPDTRSWVLYGYEHLQRYTFIQEFIRNKIILDAACGSGYGSFLLATEGNAKFVVGMDISEEAISYCKRYNNSNLSYRLGDCMQLTNLKEKFEVVISFETVEHLSNPREFFNQVNQILLPGGMFICSTPNKLRLSGAGNINPFHPSELSYEEFKNTFKLNFSIVKEFHQSETLHYSRYLELKHLLAKVSGRASAYLINRIENKMRKAVGKEFVYENYIRPDLDALNEGDIEIKELKESPQEWHKTFIFVGKKIR